MKRPSDNPMFVSLIRMAQSDMVFKHRLLSILTLGDKDRHGALESFAEELKLKGHPPEDVAAIQSLVDDSVRATALEAIQMHFREDSSITMPAWYPLLSASAATVAGLVALIITFGGLTAFAHHRNIPLHSKKTLDLLCMIIIPVVSAIAVGIGATRMIDTLFLHVFVQIEAVSIRFEHFIANKGRFYPEIGHGLGYFHHLFHYPQKVHLTYVERGVESCSCNLA